MEEGLRGMESSGPAFVVERPSISLVQPAAEGHDRGEAQGDPSMMDSKAYAHWRKTGETSPELFQKPKEEESGDNILERLTDAELSNWKLTGKLPEKPAKDKPERIAREQAAKADTAEDLGQDADADPVQTVAEHVKKITPEVHQRNVAELQAKLKQEFAKLPDRDRMLKAADQIGGITPKFADFLKHGLADLPNTAAVAKYLVTNPHTIRTMQELTPPDAVAALHQISARVAGVSKWQSRVESARARYSDFNEVALAEYLPIREGGPVDQFILASPKGSDVLYHLGKNHQELAKINRMSPIAAVRELSRIEANLSGASNGSSGRGPTVKRVSSAPPPPRTVNATSTAGSDEVFQALKDDNFEDYRAKANARDMARARR